MSIRSKLLSAIGVCSGAFAAFALLTWNTIDTTKITGASYQAIVDGKVSGVQTSASSALSNIEQIATVVRDVNGIVISIATAVEEQSVVTRDVAGNVAQASTGVQDTAQRVTETATVSESIAREVAKVRQAATDIRQGGEDVEKQASELSTIASALTSAVERFKLDPAI